MIDLWMYIVMQCAQGVCTINKRDEVTILQVCIPTLKEPDHTGFREGDKKLYIIFVPCQDL